MENANHLKVAEQGRQSVISKLHEFGVQDIEYIKHGNKVQIVATNKSRTITLLSRTRKKGSWQTTINYGKPCKENQKETTFWVFVDLQLTPPAFYIVPEWWIVNNIFEVHNDYIKNYGGKRRYNPDAKHHSINEKRIKNYKERWDLLKLV